MDPLAPRLTAALRSIALLASAGFVLGCATARLPTLSDAPLSRSDEARANEVYERGLDLVEARSYADARIAFTTVVEEYPSSRHSARALYWQGRTAYLVGDDALAERALRRYVALGPEVPDRDIASLTLANSLFNQGEFERSLEVAAGIATIGDDRLGELVALARDLVPQLPRPTIEAAAGRPDSRPWLAPIYLQAARWAHADGEARRGQDLARLVTGFAGLPPEIVAEARALASPGGPTAAGRPRLGFLIPAEPRFAAIGDQVRRGVDLALEEANRGRSNPIELVPRSTASNPDSTEVVIRTLARSDRVQAILGPLTSEYALPAGRAAAQEGVALVSPTATDARMLAIDSRVFTVNALDGAIGHTMGTYAVRTLGRRRCAILAVDNAYGRVQADAFTQAVRAAGGEVVHRTDYEPGSTRFTDRLGDVVRSRADAVFLATKSPNEALRILNQMAFFELDDLLALGTDAWNDAGFTEQGRRFARGYFADTFSRDPRVTAWADFAARYEARYGEPPPSLIPAWGYDAARLALERFTTPATPATAGSGPITLRGASALYRYTPDGVRRAVVVHRVNSGRVEAVEW